MLIKNGVSISTWQIQGKTVCSENNPELYSMMGPACYNETPLIIHRCFITNSYSALGGVIAPVLLILLFVAVVFVKAFQVTPQWQAYDDIYRGRYNINGKHVHLINTFYRISLFVNWRLLNILWLHVHQLTQSCCSIRFSAFLHVLPWRV